MPDLDDHLLKDLLRSRETIFQSYLIALQSTSSRAEELIKKAEKKGPGGYYSQNDEILRYARQSRDRSYELAVVNKLIKKAQSK